MKKILSVALLGLAATVAQAQTPQQIVQKFYPKYSQKHQCYQVNVKNMGEYCVRRSKVEMRETAQGRQMYLLFTGNAFNFKRNAESGSHVQSGLAGIFVLKQKAGGWRLAAAQAYAPAGVFGTAPDAAEWSLREFGKDRWGFLTRYSDVHQGYAGSAYLIFAHNGADKIIRSEIAAAAENSGAVGDCEDNLYEDRRNTAAERRECLKSLYDLSARLEILRNGTTHAGFYPLRLTVSGSDGLKKYRNQAFTVPFSLTKNRYAAPSNYPLADKSF